MKRILLSIPILCILLAGFLASSDLLHSGYPLTHDGDVHLLRLTNFYQSLSEGILIPRWAANVNWGYGQPVFEFFYPLPSYIASGLHFLGLSFANSLKLLLGLSIVTSGITMYLWLRLFTSKWSAFLGSFLYMFAPYRFVDTYIRGDIGETFALLFVPLILYFLTLSLKSKNKYSLLLGGICLALLILSHNIVSLMSLPFILFYAAYLWWEQGRKKIDVFKITSLIFIGFALSAFFWMPGLLEGKYTLRDIVTRGEYRNRFVDVMTLFYGPWVYGGSGTFTVQLGIAHWLVILGSSVLFILKKLKQQMLVIALLVYTFFAIFLMLPVSSVVWSKIILLQNFQFPWRFLLVTTFSTSILGALFVDNLPKNMRKVCVILLAVVCLVVQNQYWHAKEYVARPDNTFEGIFKGPSDTGESSPIWGIRFMESGFDRPLEVLDGNAVVQVGKRTTITHTYIVDAKSNTQLMENTLYFPGWHIYVDGKEVTIEFQSQLHRGLMLFSVPAGKHTIQIAFMETKFRQAADDISLISLIVLGLLLLPLPKRFTIPL